MEKKNTLHHSLTKKVLSVFLAVVMLVSTFAVGIVPIKLMAEAASVKAYDVSMGDLTFVVPEAIYLYPNATAWKDATSTPFQYYINDTISGGASSSADLTGNIFFYYANASTATLRAQFVDGSFNALSGGSITVGGTTVTTTNLTVTGNSSSAATTITAGSSPSLAAATTGCYILWTLSFTDTTDNKSKTAYALTYVYKPYTVPAGVCIDIKDKYKPHYNKQISWMVGFHGMTDGNSGSDDGYYYPLYTTGNGLACFASKYNKGYVGSTEYTSGSNTIQRDISGYTVISQTTTTGQVRQAAAERWYLLFANTANSTYHFRTSASNSDESEWFNGGTNDASKTYPYPFSHADDTDKDMNHIQTATARYRGTITIDTSRYSDLSQIPNLSVGLFVVSDASSSSGGHWYVADNTGGTALGNNYANGNGNASTYLGYYKHIIAGQYTGRTDMNWSETEGIRYAGPYVKTIDSNASNKEYKIHTQYSNWYDGAGGNDYYVFTHGEISLHATQYNKSSLRSAVMNAIKKFPQLGVNGISSGNITSCYFDSNTSYVWTNLQSAFKAAVLALTKVDGGNPQPDANTNLATNLNNALNALCTKVTLNANGGTFGSTSTIDRYVQIGTAANVAYTPASTDAPTRAGYTFAGWARTSSGAVETTPITVGYNNTLYAKWTPNTYTVHFKGNGNTGGSTADQGFTYESGQTLRANGFTRAYTVTYNHNYTGSTDTSATATYTFKNWMGATRQCFSDSGTYSGSGVNVSPYHDFKSYTVNQPFAAGQKYILEFDAKGTGNLINYFYGNSGYLQCSNATSSEGVTSSGTDGNITHALTDEFKHYTITWTLGSSGSGTVNKIVLFRLMNGNNTCTIKNVNFYQAEVSSNAVRTFTNQQTGVTNLTSAANGTYYMVADWTPKSITLETPTRNGYTFGGWYRNPPAPIL